MERSPDGTYSFEEVVDVEDFSTTALHEVGHAVDFMLGAKTELVYDLAGWKRFEHGDFDAWAIELGDWETVPEPARREIRQVWISWLSGGAKGRVAELVDSLHPLHDMRYATVGAVALAHRDGVGDQLSAVNGRHAMGKPTHQSWFTLSRKGYNAAPSLYSLTAPEEYFAECYANYYREFVAAPKHDVEKGRTLVPWIKRWFDEKIDRAGHNPQRRRS